MPRLPRLFLTDFPHHIVQRGHNRNAVFHEPRDFEIYLRNLAEQSSELQIDVIAYCLMTNHVHLLLTPRRAGDDLSKLMRVLAARQTRHVNRVAGRSGTLWEGRFKCSLVDTDGYLLACCVYIDANPLRAGLVGNARTYPWSSCRMRDVQVAMPVPLRLPDCYLSLGSSADQRRARYLETVHGGLPEKMDSTIRRGVQHSRPTGSAGFIRGIESQMQRSVVAKSPGRPRRL